ncbi:MAG: coproporphyrinogen dehydrogenase HemZ [Clostridiales bacterium]|nr:coproporphyrinogen dehydrogenase HemZ [Clostridiales bacterium]
MRDKESAKEKNAELSSGQEPLARIVVRLEGHAFYYPVSDVLRLFTGAIPKEEDGKVVCDATAIFPGREELFSDEKALTIRSRVTEEWVETVVEKDDDSESDVSGDASAIVVQSAPQIFIDREDLDLPINREVKRQLYFLLSRILKISFPWGSLTGIRPTQVARELDSEEDMQEIYAVRSDKAHLAFLTRDRENAVLSGSSPDVLHVYIGIPFCPSRCSYCSFISQEAPRKTEILPGYVDAVLTELDLVLPKITSKIETLYVGGGTPTVLPEVLFEKFIRGVLSHPEFRSVREVCVEAGRPDTITKRKLEVLAELGVNRICINPQTLCDATLQRVGRKHSAKDFTDAFEMAREMGFSVINTDLIAGLPGETTEEFCESLMRIIALRPENVTVHALSKKRRSSLRREEVVQAEDNGTKRVENMLSFASQKLLAAGYSPYYMYKQKDTIGGHENIGYCLDGTECIYNVAMMSDLRSVLSFGAGGMSKRVFLNPAENDGSQGANVRIERCPCIKEPTQYITDVTAMAERKIRFFEGESTCNSENS